jgi:ATP-dependent protease ClpP protease subunit
MNFKFARNIVDKEFAEMSLYSEIGGENGINAQRFVDELNYLVNYTGIKEVRIRINSVGGMVIEGIGIFSAIRNINNAKTAVVNTYNDGIAASIAGVIMLAGAKRYAKPYARTMIHGVSLPSTKEDDLTDNDKAGLNSLAGMLAEVFEGYAGKDEGFFAALLSNKSDNWFGTKEAIALGLVDEIEADDLGFAPEANALSPEAIYNRINQFYNHLTTQSMKGIAMKFGLGENATEQEIIHKVSALQDERDTLTAENESLKAELEEVSEAAAVEAVENAIKQGKISDAGKVAALASAKSNLKGFNALIGSLTIKAPNAANQIQDEGGNGAMAEEVKGKTFRELERKNPELLNRLKREDKATFVNLYNAQYSTNKTAADFK